MSTRMQPISVRQTGVGTDVALGTARVVVVDDNQLRATALAAAIKASADAMITIMPPDAGRPVDELVGADLVLLALGGRNVSALATGAEAVQRNPFAEVVFYCANPDAPEVAAAGVLGITRIVPAQQMVAWLSRAGELLARGAYLRRAAAAAIAAAPVRLPWPASPTRRRGRSRCRRPRCSSARATSVTCSPRAAADRRQLDGPASPTAPCAR